MFRPNGGCRGGQAGGVLELQTYCPFEWGTSLMNQQPMCTSRHEISDGKKSGVTGAGNGSGTTGAVGKGDPALHVDVGSIREKSEGLVDTTPGPIARAVGETPELAWAHRSRVARPRLWRWGEVRECQFRE